MIPTVAEVHTANNKASLMLKEAKLYERRNNKVQFMVKKNFIIMVRPDQIETEEQRNAFITKYKNK